MSQRLTINQNNKPIYDIVFEQDFAALPSELEQFQIADKKLCIITDSKVNHLYSEEVCDVLKDKCKEVVVFSFPDGEKSKNLDTVKDIYEFLIQHKFDRKDMLFALGGGVVGDITGFAAATYLRGIDFVQIPTTLLAQVDSSVGGKTGVDFDQYKNMVGAFHMPRLVYTNVKTLTTLSQEQFSSGMGEIIKHGLIKDAAYYQWLKDNREKIMARDLEACADMIKRSDEIKREVVEKDPTEQGDRALLNFGHTLGHAIEKLKNFQMLHGHCVGVGCIAAAAISQKRGYLTEAQVQDIRETMKAFQVEEKVSGVDPAKVVAATKNDKKMDGNTIKFILLKEIGSAYVDRQVTEEEMKLGLEAVLE